MKAKLNVLIADDDEEQVSMFVDALHHVADCEVTTAADGVECLRLLQQGCKPDLLFVDQHMKRKTGMECLREIHDHNLLAGTPIIIYGVSCQLKDLNIASAFGASFYLLKPYSPGILKMLLKHMLDILTRSLNGESVNENFYMTQQRLWLAG
jgi:CheY-like chemotaxis protein